MNQVIRITMRQLHIQTCMKEKSGRVESRGAWHAEVLGRQVEENVGDKEGVRKEWCTVMDPFPEVHADEFLVDAKYHAGNAILCVTLECLPEKLKCLRMRTELMSKTTFP
jgi:hypothetical protein